MTADDLVARLLRIEALHAGATTPGERAAAELALARIRERLRQQERLSPPVPMRFALRDPWARRLFLALVRRYGLHPYRMPRQHYSSVMVRVSRQFVDETLWPEFLALHAELNTYLGEVTERVIAEALHADSAEAPEVHALEGHAK